MFNFRNLVGIILTNYELFEFNINFKELMYNNLPICSSELL